MCGTPRSLSTVRPHTRRRHTEGEHRPTLQQARELFPLPDSSPSLLFHPQAQPAGAYASPPAVPPSTCCCGPEPWLTYPTLPHSLASSPATKLSFQRLPKNSSSAFTHLSAPSPSFAVSCIAVLPVQNLKRDQLPNCTKPKRRTTPTPNLNTSQKRKIKVKYETTSALDTVVKRDGRGSQERGGERQQDAQDAHKTEKTDMIRPQHVNHSTPFLSGLLSIAQGLHHDPRPFHTFLAQYGNPHPRAGTIGH